MTQPNPYIAAIDAALAICEARLAACDAATPNWDGEWLGHIFRNLHNWTDHDFIDDYRDSPVPFPQPGWGKDDYADGQFAAAARTDHPASLRIFIAGLQAHRDAEVELVLLYALDVLPTPAIEVWTARVRQRCACEVHRAYSQRIFAELGVEVAS